MKQAVSEWQTLSPEDYRELVDARLETRYGTTVNDILAGSFVAAAREAGFSPFECFQSLARAQGFA